MKQAIPTAELMVVPDTDHTINLKEPETYNDRPVHRGGRARPLALPRPARLTESITGIR
jgi:hypothetical protein